MGVFRKLFFEIPYFLFQIEVFKLNCLFLRKGFFCFGLTSDERLLKRGILIRDQEQALFEYRRRAMFGNQLFDSVEQPHENPNAELTRAPQGDEK
mgnify:CR=1 FL=1